MKTVKDAAKLFVTEMSGWICLILTLTMSVGVLLKIPIGTEYFALTSNLLMAYITISTKLLDKQEDKPKTAEPPVANPNPPMVPDVSPNLQTK